MVFYTDKLVPEGRQGCARGPFIFIRPADKADEGLLAHEETHVDQFWFMGLVAIAALAFVGVLTGLQFLIQYCVVGIALHSLLYKFSKTYRFKAEVEAYKTQLEHYPEENKTQLRSMFAHYIADTYNLNVSYQEAYDALME